MRNNSTPRYWKVRFLEISLRIVLLVILIVVIFIVTFLKIGYNRAAKPVSYLPGNYPEKLLSYSDSMPEAEIKGRWYTLSVGSNGKVCVKTTRGEVIMSSLTYYSSCKDSSEKWGLTDESVSTRSDSTIYISGKTLSGTTIGLMLTVPKNKPKIDIDITASYTKNTIVDREALVAGFDIPVSEIFRKNRQADTGQFEPEYWLLREGVRFGRGNRSALVYHTPEVSSLQTETNRRLLFVNLEYSLDHPYYNIPFQKDAGGKWVDLSDAAYHAGDSRHNTFSIYFGGMPETVPRIMLVPYGYLAGYVFTEHADGGNIRTHRAAYFGSEDITNIDSAIGGFARYKIPVTKSVFFPDLDVTSDSSGKTISENRQFLGFLDQLNSKGTYDICLHGANANRKNEEKWIKFMKERFNTTTWIDHGMFNGTGNRQSFVCDGLDPASEFYTADIWKTYNTQYFWNASVEEIRKYTMKEKLEKLGFFDASIHIWSRHFSPDELNHTNFLKALLELKVRYREKGELNSFLPSRGSSFPTPLFWLHPTRTMNFYSWVTDYFKSFSRSSEGVAAELVKINSLISDWGIFINHGYFVRNLWIDGVLTSSGGKMEVAPSFNKILESMSRHRDDGDLYITTIRDLLDYWKLTEKVTFDYRPDGVIIFNNPNDKCIKGFSLAVKADSVKIDDKIPDFRKANGNTVLWFDFPAGSSVRLEFK